MSLSRGRRGHRAGPAHGPPAAAHPRGARLRALTRRRLHADPAGARASGMAYVGVARAVGRSPARTWRSSSARTGESSSMAQLDGSDIVYVARVSVPKIIALRVEIGTRFPAAADLAGQGAARRPATRRRWTPCSPTPSRVRPRCRTSSATARALDDELARVRARGWALADEELAPGVRSVAVPGARRRRRGAGRHERHRARRRDLDRAPARRAPPAAAAHGRRGQRRLGAVAAPPARRGGPGHRHPVSRRTRRRSPRSRRGRRRSAARSRWR